MKKTKMCKAIAISLVILLMASAFSCGGGGGSSASVSSGKSSVTITISGLKAGAVSAAAVPANVANIKFIISASDMETIERTVSAAGQETIVQSFEVPNGLNRHFLVEAFAQDGSTILYQGDKFANLDGTETNMSILMGYDISGPWVFSLGGGSASMSFTQTGNSLTFSATLPGGTAAAASSRKGSASGITYTGNGSINGNNIELSGTGPVECNNVSIFSFTGTVVNGTLMTGTLTLSGGCLTSPQTFSLSAEQGNVPPQIDITGSWSIDRTPGNGPRFYNLVQTGNTINVTVAKDDGTLINGTGTLNGSAIQLSYQGGDNCGNTVNITLTGTVSADGKAASGDFVIAGDCGATGTWTGTKAQTPAGSISGSWSGFETPDGGTEQGPACMTITQTGSFFTFTGDIAGSGILSGDNIQLRFATFSGSNGGPTCKTVNNLTGTVGAGGGSAIGSYTTVNSGSGCGNPVSGSWRLIRGTCSHPQPPTSPVDVVITLP